jgi:hypothetical protein
MLGEPPDDLQPHDWQHAEREAAHHHADRVPAAEDHDGTGDLPGVAGTSTHITRPSPAGEPCACNTDQTAAECGWEDSDGGGGRLVEDEHQYTARHQADDLELLMIADGERWRFSQVHEVDDNQQRWLPVSGRVNAPRLLISGCAHGRERRRPRDRARASH